MQLKMETFKKLLSVILILVIVVIAYLCMVLYEGPKNTFLKIAEGIRYDATVDSTYNHPQFDSAVRALAYKQALTETLVNDSIYLVVNTIDSTVNLIIRGVEIHSSKMIQLESDDLLSTFPNNMYYGLFSRPLEVMNIRSTIVKEPIVEIEAPKNEEEASKNSYMPDTLIQYPAFLHLSLQYGIELMLYQDSIDSKEEVSTFKPFEKHHNDRRKEHFYNSLMRKSPYYYEPKITIVIPIDELRAIYRAVPHKINVIVKFG